MKKRLKKKTLRGTQGANAGVFTTFKVGENEQERNKLLRRVPSLKSEIHMLWRGYGPSTTGTGTLLEVKKLPWL